MRRLMVLSAVNGFLAVALGAFGAHGLEERLGLLVAGSQRLQWWQTAAHYHLTHALALGLAAWLAGRVAGSLPLRAGGLLLAGILLFSGSLYVMALTDLRALGAITPVGGLALLGGWLCLGLAARRLDGGPTPRS